MASITVDVDIDEFDDDDLIEELKSRGYTVNDEDEEEDDDVPETSRTRLPSSYTIKRDFDRHQLRSHLLDITGQGSYVSDEELLSKLKDLLTYG